MDWRRLLLERLVYLMARLGLASFGVFLVSGAYVSVYFPDPLYSDGPPPPLADRLPAALAELVAGFLFLTPFGWTRRGWVFWPRLVASIVVGLFVMLMGATAIGLGLAGGRDPLIFLAGLLLALVGAGLPAALYWRCRLDRSGDIRP